MNFYRIRNICKIIMTFTRICDKMKQKRRLDMSISSIQNEIKNLSNEIGKLNKSLSDEQKNESKKMNEIARIKRTITKNTSISMLNSKTRQIERLNKDIMKSKSKQADISKKLGDKQKKYGLKQIELNKEQERIQKQIMQNQKKLEQQQIINMQQYKYVQEESEAEKEYDFFISHASEDKEEVAEPLARELEKLGAKVWFDKFTLKIGDSLRKSIDSGLANSKFGIVILTNTYFKKFWTEKELNGLFSRYSEGNCRILPIWHNISKEEVSKNSLILADILGLKTADYTIEEIAKELYGLLN